jgi:hypothetical protein
MISDVEIESRARLYAGLHGGKIVDNGETVAYRAGRREGWWTQGRGVNNGDCVTIYQDRHWKNFVDQARNTQEP